MFSGFIRRHTKNRDYDPEKAVPSDLRHSDDLDHDGSDEDHDQPSQDALASNTPHRRVRRVYSSVTHPAFSPSPTTSDDNALSKTKPSLWQRTKEYFWPSDAELADLDNYVPNYRWTPILAGIIIPFSILLEIPGLTDKWYIKTENNQIVAEQPNTVILELGQAFSMTCVIIANGLLILRFLEKRVKTVTLLCILFLTVHDLINIITVTIFGIEHRFDDGFTYGQAFWSTLCSTVISSVTNITLIVDFVRTPDFAKRGSGLTRKQRALVIVVMILFLYIAFCGLVSSVLMELTFINGLYFTVVSIETIGFGDIVPTTAGTRVWTCVFISFGVITIGVAIAMCRETILEGLEIGYRRRVRNMRERRRDARRFRRWEARWRRAVEFRLREKGEPIMVPDAEAEDKGAIRVLGLDTGVKLPFFQRVGTQIKRTATMTSVDSVLHPTKRRKHHLNIEALSNAQLEEAALEAGVPLELFCDLGARRDELHHPTPPDATAIASAAHNVKEAVEGGAHLVDAVHAQTRATVFHDAISRGWVEHPETPTQAQVGRMSAMLTKFALAVSGHHMQPPAYSHSTYVQEATTAHPHKPPSHNPSQEGRRPGPSRLGSYADIKQHPATKWLKEFARGANQRKGWSYMKLQEEMQQEEQKAYWAKFIIVWTLFFLFWTVGAGIFCATEGWTYAIAIYFCFIAFSTTGYGDYTPESPAGRTIFVFWALFGVGTLTILVSVLQEAGSSKYKSALHSRVFDKAVKKYRKANKDILDKRPASVFDDTKGNTGTARSGKSTLRNRARATPTVRLREAQEEVQRALEVLPCEIIRSARTFRDDMQFFLSGSSIDAPEEDDANVGKRKLPPDMKKLLDELGSMEGINERLKTEILQDEDARKTLFMLSLERSLKRLVTSAEKALVVLTERDALATIVEKERKPRGRFSSRGLRAVLDHWDEQPQEEGESQEDGRHTVRAQSEPPPSHTPGHRPERLPRTSSEGSLRDPGDEPKLSLDGLRFMPLGDKHEAPSPTSSSSSSSTRPSSPVAS